MVPDHSLADSTIWHLNSRQKMKCILYFLIHECIMRETCWSKTICENAAKNMASLPPKHRVQESDESASHILLLSILTTDNSNGVA